MEIRISNDNSRNYYNEVLGVMSNYKELIENPKQKIQGLTRQATILTGISIAFLAIFSILYLNDASNMLYMIVVIIFAATVALGIIYYLLINRRINSIRNGSSDKRLIIEDDYVKMIVDGDRTSLVMSDIQYVLMNKHSICFLPRTENTKMIAVNIIYKDSVLDALNDKSIIIDNTGLY